jgi:N-acetylneuraminate synthase
MSSSVKQPNKIEKEWGYEIWLTNNKEENYCGKILYINKGCSTSMHFHAKKHESFYILEGDLQIDLIDTSTTETSCELLKTGDVFSLGRLTPHKLIAKNGPVKFIETSTYHEDRDSYRVWK